MMVLRLMSFLFMAVFHFSTVSAQFSFSQPATGPSSVCEGSNVTLQCRVVFNGNPAASMWFRNGTAVQVGNSFIPNHSVVVNSTTGQFTDLVITNVTLKDDNTVYTCTAIDDSINSSVVLNVLEIPPVQNLMVVDQCTTIRASWDITEGSCTDLSYDVTLSSSVGVTLQGPNTTSDTIYNFTDVETFNGNLNVNVVPINNGNARGASVTETAVTGVSPNDLPAVTNIRNVSTICVTYFNISWDAPSITCGDVSYEVSISQPPTEGDAITNTVDTSLSITGLNNSLPDVTITVTARDRVDQRNGSTSVLQLRTPQDPPPVHNLMPPYFQTLDDVAGFDVPISWERPMIDRCTTLQIAGYNIDINVTFTNGSQDSYTSKFISDTRGGSMGKFSVNYSELFNEPLEPNSLYTLSITPTNNPGGNPDDDDDGDGSSTVIIIIVVIFALIVIIGSIIVIVCCIKYDKCPCIRKDDCPCFNKGSKDGDTQELKSPTGISESHRPGKGSVQPSNVPHQTAASGEEYAVTSKVVTKPQQQQPQEYAMVDKSKKHSAATQGIMYADLQDLPSGAPPPQNQGPTSTYAMVA